MNKHSTTCSATTSNPHPASLCPLQLFVASVLLEPELGLTPMPSPAHQSYGALARSQSRSSHGPAEDDMEEGEEEAGGPSGTHETRLQDPQDGPYCSVMDSTVGYQ